MTRIFEARAPGKALRNGARPSFTGGASSGLLRRFGLWAVLVLVTVAFMVGSSTFRQTNNLENILEQNAIIGVVACGMVIMMIAGGFDLSVGAVGATASVVGAAVSAHHGTVLAIIAGLATGLVAGTVNGFLVARVKINPFIATFAMASIVSGLLFVATSAQSKQGNSPFLDDVASNRWGGIPIVFIVFLVFLIAVWMLLTRTRYGHYVYSVGGNAEASHLSGVPVQRVQTFAFIIGGLFAGAAGLLLTGQTGIGQPSAATDWPLQAIAICVVAGVALTGGIGRAPDVLAATLVLGVIANGLNQLSVSPYWQPTVTGLVILVAVTLDRYNRVRRTTSAPPAAGAEPAVPIAAGEPSNPAAPAPSPGR
jgi:ribose/xylose/arabinose/galactoside ABC-type transport system permease subunit